MIPVKVSVLLPFYNPGSYFREAIESVLNQDFSEFELLLIDNNSDAASVKIAREYQAIDGRIKLLHEQQQGISFALNAGLRSAKGNLIARMDADDVCLPGRLKLQYVYMQNYPETGMIAGLIQPALNEVNNGMLHFIRQNNTLINPEQIFHHRFWKHLSFILQSCSGNP